MQPISLFQCNKCKKIYNDFETAKHCCENLIDNKKIKEFKDKLKKINTFSEVINSKEKYIQGILFLKEIKKTYNEFNNSEQIEVISEYQNLCLKLETKLCNFYEKSFNKLLFDMRCNELFNTVVIDSKEYKICDCESDFIKMFSYTYELEKTIKER